MTGYIILGVLVLLVLYVILTYNNIVRSNNEIDKAFGSVDAMLKKRYDLIPNLVEVVKQYMIHESTVLTEVTKLRTSYSENMTSEDKIDLHNKITSKVSGLLYNVENYPDLKANQNFLHLQASWNEAEEQISAARRYYNSAVTDYNNSIQTFPSSIIAKQMGFKHKNVFEISEEERKNINAKELFAK
ncbi:MAG: LemA family protein [Bacteroidota bacterium]